MFVASCTSKRSSCSSRKILPVQVGRVVDEQVDGTESLEGVIEEPIDCVTLAQVGVDRQNVHTVFAQQARR